MTYMNCKDVYMKNFLVKPFQAPLEAPLAAGHWTLGRVRCRNGHSSGPTSRTPRLQWIIQ